MMGSWSRLPSDAVRADNRGDTVTGEKNAKKRSAKKTPAKKAAKKRSAKKATKNRSVKKSSSSSKVPVAPVYPWSVSKELVKKLSDNDLDSLLAHLLQAEGRLRGLRDDQITVNAEGDAKDDGADAFTEAPTSTSVWLGDAETCWQFKAGKQGEAKKLETEVEKRIPRETLENGGRFVVVASGSANGKKGRDDRLKSLRAAARAVKLPASTIRVYTAEDLVSWLEDHPAVAMAFQRMPSGWMTLDNWGTEREHRKEWHETKSLLATRQALHDALADQSDTPHVHLYGPVGIGKTRLALEACKTAPWSEYVVYVDDHRQIDVPTWLRQIGANPEARVVLVVDDVPTEELRRFSAAVGRFSGRLRVLTIGHQRSPDLTTIPEKEVGAIDELTMAKIVGGWHGVLPDEHRRFVAKFSGGFVRLAWLAANALVEKRATNAAELLEQTDIRSVLDTLLGEPERRQSLYVVAALESVGWFGPSASEGRAIATHLGLEWNRVVADVDALDRKLGIAPRRGDLRHISPEPLGALIATEAWRAFPERMQSLSDALPSEEARAQFDRRSTSIAATPHVAQFARDNLEGFFSLEHFVTESSVRRWRAFSPVAPVRAAQRLRKVLGEASIEERKGIAGGARRHLVHALDELAWGERTFEDAMLSLAHLAVAENETWSNNAGGEFRKRFQIHLGATAASYADRLAVADKLLAQENADYRVLIVESLSKGFLGGETRTDSGHPAHRPRESEWRPTTGGQVLRVVEGVCERLQRVAENDEDPAVRAALMKTLKGGSMLLREPRIRGRIAQAMRSLAQTAAEREQLWLEIGRIVDLETRHWKSLEEADLEWLEQLQAEFAEDGVPGKVRRELRSRELTREKVDRTELASEVLADPDDTLEVWRWLGSGEGLHVWDFGADLASVDAGDTILALDPGDLVGADVRPLGGYLSSKAVSRGPDWLDDCLDRISEHHPNAAVELTARCAPTKRGLSRLQHLLEKGAAEASASYIGYCRVADDVGAEDLVSFLEALAAIPRHAHVALNMLSNRLDDDEGFLTVSRDVALTLVQNPDLIRGGGMTVFFWGKVASRLLPDAVQPISAAILAAHAKRDGRSWFVEHSEAAPTLWKCVEYDPASVWREAAKYLEDEEQAAVFAIGLPEGLIDRFPREDVLAWIAEDPAYRSAVVSRLVAKTFNEESLFAQILERFEQRDVASALRSHFTSGSWWGEASAHWEALANSLESVAADTSRPALARWATETMRQLREMAKGDRKREEERRLRGY